MKAENTQLGRGKPRAGPGSQQELTGLGLHSVGKAR